MEVHPENRGYGANQKTCYRLALAADADIIIMIHPDYQYTPQLIPAMAALVGSRTLPLRAWFAHSWRRCAAWRYAVMEIRLKPASDARRKCFSPARSSRNITGYRAYSRQLLERLPLERNSDDFVFDKVEVLSRKSSRSAARSAK